ncbi:MAG: uncharacterized protein JWR16_1653 [Nevskia sp.]|nr:uncharacterized protein [Nevskia sp.]
MDHWIITNRQIVKVGGRETVNEKDHEPLPSFRIAKFTVPAADASDDAYRAAVELIPDKADSSYRPADPQADPDRLKGTAQIFLSLYQAMSNAPADKGDTLVFLHGFNYSWVDSLRHLAKLHELYVADARSPIAQIVYFSWPSFGDVLKYHSDQPIALDSGSALGRLFRKVGEFYASSFAGKSAVPYCGRKLHLAAHSMGNQVLDAFCKVVNGFDGLHLNLFSEVVLLNADADWSVLDPQQPLANLNEYSDRTHVYCNHHDEALLISETTKNREKRLGRHGPKDIADIPPRTVVVDVTDDVLTTAGKVPDLDQFAANAEQILRRSGLLIGLKETLVQHWGYLYRPDIIADVQAVFRGESASAIAARSKKTDDLFSLKPK